MAIDRRFDYGDETVLSFADLNRWSINGSPQYLDQAVMSGATVRQFVGVFNLNPSTAYSHFKIIVNKLTTSVGGLRLNMKLMSGASLSGSTYDQAYQQVTYAGALSYAGGTGLTSWNIVRNTSTTDESSAIIDVFNPFVALTVTGMSKISNDDTSYSTSSGRIGNSNAFDGFELSLKRVCLMVVRAAYTSLEVPTHTDWNSYILNGALVYLAEYDVSSLVSEIGMDYAFSYPAEQFRNFRVVLGNLVGGTANLLLIQMKNATVPAAPALYNGNNRTINTAGAPTNDVRVNAVAFIPGTLATSTSLKSYYVFDICTPQSGFATTFYGRGGQLGATQTIFSGQLNNCQVYGYRTEL